MKVVLITGSYPNHPCGVGDYTACLARNLAREGLDVRVLTTNLPEIKGVESPNIEVIKAVSSWKLVNAPSLMRALFSIQPDIIHIEYPSRGYGNHLLATLLPVLVRIFKPGARLVVTLHEFTQAHFLRKLASLPLIQFCHNLVLTDEGERRAVSRLTGVGKLRLIPIGPNIEPSGMPNRSAIDPFIVYYGFASKTKDIATLLESFKMIADKTRCNLVMITTLDQKEHSSVLGLIKKLNLSERVTVTGYISPGEVTRYLSGALACVLPFSDGISMRRGTWITALRHGLPVITTVKNRIPTMFKNWQNVILVGIGRPDQISESVIRLIQDPTLRQTISENAVSISESFSWKIIASEHAKLYKTLV